MEIDRLLVERIVEDLGGYYSDDGDATVSEIEAEELAPVNEPLEQMTSVILI